MEDNMSTIQEKIDKLLEMQEKTLSKQELMNVRSMNTEELLQQMIREQKRMRHEFDKLYKKWGWDVKEAGVI